MTGPEHYREADRLVDSNEQDAVARAQVHATLALAAAYGLAHAADMPEDDFQGWLHTVAAHFKAGAS